MAGRTGESFPRRVAFSFENMERVWAGQAPESVVTENRRESRLFGAA